jgi:recombinational DNA repair protein RecR
MSASVRDITTAIVQEIGKRDARIYELELISARDRTDTAALADALRDAGPMQDSCQRCASDARALLARVDGDGA